jgi:hypothetical protein
MNPPPLIPLCCIPTPVRRYPTTTQNKPTNYTYAKRRRDHRIRSTSLEARDQSQNDLTSHAPPGQNSPLS